MKTVVVFQGGGALGAFGAGAWQALAEQPGVRDGPLVAVAGLSIGALTAAAVAYHHQAPDGGAQALASLWLDRIATPSWPFFGPLPWPVAPSAATADHWNGFITGVLLGNRGLFAARWPQWQPLSGLARLQQPLHDRRAMWQMLEEEFPSYASVPGGPPLLATAAVDLMSGELRLFDSDSSPVTARHLAASSAIPLLFDPVEIDGRLHWDGEITRDSVLPLLLERLLRNGRLSPAEPVQLVTVEQFPRSLAAPPCSGVEISYRALNLLQLGKLDPPPMEGLRIGRLRRIVREPLPEDGVSGQFDYSYRRIRRLMAEGRRMAGLAVPESRPALVPPTTARGSPGPGSEPADAALQPRGATR